MKLFVIPWGGLLFAIYFKSGFIATPIPDGAGLAMGVLRWRIEYIYLL